MKKIIKVLMVILVALTITGCMKENIESDKTSQEKSSKVYNFKIEQDWDGIFDLTKIAPKGIGRIVLKNSDSNPGILIACESDKSINENSNYTINYNTSGYEELISVVFDYYKNFYGSIDKTNAEIFAVQLAVFGRVNGVDPISLEIITKNEDFVETAEKIKDLAHKLYISDYRFESKEGVTLLRYKDKELIVPENYDYSFNYSDSIVLNINNKYYWNTDFMFLGSNQNDYVDDTKYTITLSNAPEGTIITNATGEQIGTTSATFTKDSEVKAFRILVPFNQEERSGEIVVTINGTLDRMTGIILESIDSANIIARTTVTDVFEKSFKISYDGKNNIDKDLVKKYEEILSNGFNNLYLLSKDLKEATKLTPENVDNFMEIIIDLAKSNVKNNGQYPKDIGAIVDEMNLDK